MLTTIQNALKTKEIRMKLLYVLIGLVIVRIGCTGRDRAQVPAREARFRYWSSGR